MADVPAQGGHADGLHLLAERYAGVQAGRPDQDMYRQIEALLLARQRHHNGHRTVGVAEIILDHQGRASAGLLSGSQSVKTAPYDITATNIHDPDLLISLASRLLSRSNLRLWDHSISTF